jgi:hypothetical protein
MGFRDIRTLASHSMLRGHWLVHCLFGRFGRLSNLIAFAAEYPQAPRQVLPKSGEERLSWCCSIKGNYRCATLDRTQFDMSRISILLIPFLPIASANLSMLSRRVRYLPAVNSNRNEQNTSTFTIQGSSSDSEAANWSRRHVVPSYRCAPGRYGRESSHQFPEIYVSPFNWTKKRCS